MLTNSLLNFWYSVVKDRITYVHRSRESFWNRVYLGSAPNPGFSQSSINMFGK